MTEPQGSGPARQPQTLRRFRVCSLAGLARRDAREFFVGGGDWPFRGFIVRLDDEIRAYANVCPHKGHPLNMAEDDFLVPDQQLVRCASHNALFDPVSGLCVFGPCAGRSLQALECWIEGDDVLVNAPATQRS